MSLQAVGCMIVAPAAVAVAVGFPLRPLGPAALLLAIAAFVAAQFAVRAQSQRRLDAANRRLAANRTHRRQPRRQA